MSPFTKNFLFGIIITVFFIIHASVASASDAKFTKDNINNAASFFSGLPKVDNPVSFGNTVANWAFALATGLAAIFILWTGVRLLTLTDQAKRQEALKGLTYSIIGLVVVVFAYAIVNLVLSLLKV